MANENAGGVKHLPAHLRKALTYDNGREMAQHAAFSLATKVAV
jgi:IS30 family transposase